jgi:hypothetical protein
MIYTERSENMVQKAGSGVPDNRVPDFIKLFASKSIREGGAPFASAKAKALKPGA